MNKFYEQYSQNIILDFPLNVQTSVKTIRDKNLSCNFCAHIYKPVPGFGVVKPRVMFIGYKAEQQDLDTGIPFSSPSGKKLMGIVDYIHRKVNIYNSIYYTNLCLCPGASDDLQKMCRIRLLEEIKDVDPKIIVLLGRKLPQIIFEHDLKMGKHALKCDKYYTFFITHSLENLYYKRDEVKNELRQHLDLVIEELKKYE